MIHIRTHQGTRWPGERLGQRVSTRYTPSIAESTYYIACFQVNPSSEFTAAAIENTIEVNQKPLTASASGFPVDSKENCKVVAVTALKKVATVDRLSRFAAACF